MAKATSKARHLAGVAPDTVVRVCAKLNRKEYGFKRPGLPLVGIIWAAPLGQGVANLNASWMQTATVNENGGLGAGERVKRGTEGGVGDLACLP